jgi:hypothetical protein
MVPRSRWPGASLYRHCGGGGPSCSTGAEPSCRPCTLAALLRRARVTLYGLLAAEFVMRITAPFQHRAAAVGLTEALVRRVISAFLRQGTPGRGARTGFRGSDRQRLGSAHRENQSILAHGHSARWRIRVGEVLTRAYAALLDSGGSDTSVASTLSRNCRRILLARSCSRACRYCRADGRNNCGWAGSTRRMSSIAFLSCLKAKRLKCEDVGAMDRAPPAAD